MPSGTDTGSQPGDAWKAPILPVCGKTHSFTEILECFVRY
jgi:hypothetical protein